MAELTLGLQVFPPDALSRLSDRLTGRGKRAGITERIIAGRHAVRDQTLSVL